MDHLGEQRVLDLVAGRLSALAAGDAHAHLDRCAECRTVVAVAMRSGRSAKDAEADTTEYAGSGTDPTRVEVPAARRGARPQPVAQLAEYRLLEEIGRGGMGTVFRAHDTLLDREVAIKLISRTSSERARQRFLVEARAVARIRHPNVVVVHRVGIDGERPYIVYDLVRGRTVADVEGPIPWFKVLALAVGIARGLAAAHACGVLHRDLKPANIMIDEHDDVILVDFGLAKLSLDDTDPELPSGDARMTQTGVAIGTPRYMAPESWRGLPPTPQTDFYGLGLVCYELLSGRLPHDDVDADALGRTVCDVDPPSLATVAPWLPPLIANLVDRCIARDPARRPVSAAALCEELEAIQRGRAFDAFERDRERRVPRGSPYPGAQPFGFEHQGVFFGRTTEVRDVIEQLLERPFVVVTGEAGVGKTSLCMAGVLPLVARGVLAGARKWVPVPVRLGRNPFGSFVAAIVAHVEDPTDLERRLREDPDPVIAELRRGHRGGCSAHVLYVDALEELLGSPDGPAFASLLGALAQPAPALRVLATLRAADLMRVAQLPGLAPVIGPSLFLLLEPRDPRDIIVEPGRLAGRALGEDVVRSLAGLPLRELQPRLAELWGSGA